jgi:hypothetical protein
MKSIVTIEWLAEKLDFYGDIIEVVHCDTYAEAREVRQSTMHKVDIGLVRDRGNDTEGLIDRQWAYIEKGKLPERFSDSGGAKGPLVPAKYHREIKS